MLTPYAEQVRADYDALRKSLLSNWDARKVAAALSDLEADEVCAPEDVAFLYFSDLAEPKLAMGLAREALAEMIKREEGIA
jgi:hypothetical protein